MRLSYTDLKNQFLRNIGKQGSTDTNILADFNMALANRYQMVWAKFKDYQSTIPFTTATVDSQQYYDYPRGTSKVVNAVVTIGSVKYTLQPIYSQEKWDMLNALQIQPTAIPQFIFPRRDDYGIWPIPRAAYTMVLNRYLRYRNLANEDYTAGTVTMTNGSAVVTGDSTTFTNTMEGRWLCITSDADGYGYWYRILTYTNATSVTLDSVWEGDTAATLSYKICDSPELPEEAHIILADGATADFYGGVRVDAEKYSQWNNKFYTGDMNNNIRDWNSENVIGGLIGLIRSYAERDDSHLVRRQPRSFPPEYKIWATTLS